MKKEKLNNLVEITAIADVSKDEKKDTLKKNDKKADKKKNPDKPSIFARIAKFFRGMISELKKVEWPPFKRTKDSSGVLAQTGIVLIVVLFFLVILTAFDSGLLALLKLLTKS